MSRPNRIKGGPSLVVRQCWTLRTDTDKIFATSRSVKATSSVTFGSNIVVLQQSCAAIKRAPLWGEDGRFYWMHRTMRQFQIGDCRIRIHQSGKTIPRYFSVCSLRSSLRWALPCCEPANVLTEGACWRRMRWLRPFGSRCRAIPGE